MSRMSRLSLPALLALPALPALLALLGLVALASACGGGGTGAEPDAGYNCAADTRGEQFTAGMMKTGGKGMTFAIESATPAPPARDDNAWVIAITDAQGTPLHGATVTVKPFMPDHNHGTGIVAQVTEEATAGTYDASPINLFMPGVWEITITAKPAGGTNNDADSAKFTFCVAN